VFYLGTRNPRGWNPPSGTSTPQLQPGWNIAGFKPTLDHLKRFGGLCDFFRRHRVDIFCLQEVKVNSKTLAQGRQYLGGNALLGPKTGLMAGSEIPRHFTTVWMYKKALVNNNGIINYQAQLVQDF